MRISKNELIFLPLGWSGEIGMNCNLYHYNGSWIMIDLVLCLEIHPFHLMN